MKRLTSATTGSETKKAVKPIEVHREFDEAKFPLLFCRRKDKEAILRQIEFWKKLRKIDLTTLILECKTGITYAFHKMRMKVLRREQLTEKGLSLFAQLMRQDKLTLVYLLWDAKEQKVARNQKRRGREVLGIELQRYIEQTVEDVDPVAAYVAETMRELAEKERREQATVAARLKEPTLAGVTHIGYLKEVGCYNVAPKKRMQRKTSRVRFYKGPRDEASEE